MTLERFIFYISICFYFMLSICFYSIYSSLKYIFTFLFLRDALLRLRTNNFHDSSSSHMDLLEHRSFVTVSSDLIDASRWSSRPGSGVAGAGVLSPPSAGSDGFCVCDSIFPAKGKRLIVRGVWEMNPLQHRLSSESVWKAWASQRGRLHINIQFE